MSSVTFEKVKKIYGKDVVAVQEFNLEIADKEFIVLVGPSGCGKSTTLRMVAGLEEISEGDIYIDDKKINHVAPKNRDIAMVFQNYALYPHMTVYENMAFALKIRKVPKAERDQIVRDAACILSISHLLDRKPKELSGGEKQRVAIGRAIVRKPKVFLMDEPLSNLDAKLRNQMRTEIIKLRQSIDTTFIYVTHDQVEAMTLGDRVVIMRGGFIMQIGTPQDVFDFPENLFVAGFIGTPQMNFFETRIEKKEGQYHIILNESVIVPCDEIQRKLEEKQLDDMDVVLGVRPEHLNIRPQGTPGCLDATLDVCEMMGSEIFMHVKLGEHDAIVRVPTIEVPAEYMTGEGKKELSVQFPPKLCHLFDKETEMNLLL